MRYSSLWFAISFRRTLNCYSDDFKRDYLGKWRGVEECSFIFIYLQGSSSFWSFNYCRLIFGNFNLDKHWGFENEMRSDIWIMKLKGEKLSHHKEYCKCLDIRLNSKINFSLSRRWIKISIENSNYFIVNTYKCKIDLVLFRVYF